MESFLSSSFGLFLKTIFQGIFTGPSFESFMLLALGWALSSRRHTVTQYLWLTGASSVKHFSRFYFFLSQAFYLAQAHLWACVLHNACRFIPLDEVIRIKVDDTVKKKTGRKIQGASYYRNGAGTARQEYRALWGLAFVYAILLVPLRFWEGHFLVVPIGLKVYLKKDLAEKLGQPFCPRSALAREIVDFVAHELPHRSIRVTGDGGYSRKDFLRELPANVTVIGRLLISSKLYHPPKTSRKGKRGRKPRKGRLIGAPKGFIRNPQKFRPHPTERGTLIREVVGIWHSVLPGVMIRVVVVWRRDYFKHHPQSKKPELEAFFTTDLTLSIGEIFSEVDDRWSIEIDLRDAQAYYGLGQDHCRKYERIVGINSFRMLLAATRTLYFLEMTQKVEHFDLRRHRPWYKQKTHPSQLDVFGFCQEVLFYEGISPTARFVPTVAEILRNQATALRQAA